MIEIGLLRRAFAPLVTVSFSGEEECLRQATKRSTNSRGGYHQARINIDGRLYSALSASPRFIFGTWSGTTSSASVLATTFRGDAGRGFEQGRAAARKSDHRQLGDNQIDRAHRGQRQRALLDDLGLALRGVLHGHDDALCAGDQVHRAAHARHHLAGDHPVREMSLLRRPAGRRAPSCRHGRRE